MMDAGNMFGDQKILLIIKSSEHCSSQDLPSGITGEMVLYQPRNMVSMDVDGTAVITCVSTEDLDTRTKISWFHHKWRRGEDRVRVKSCSSDNDTHKYICKHEKYRTSLEIYNVQLNDSGVYYCMHLLSWFSRKFGNGTNLNVGDRSSSRSSIHILSHLQPHHPNSSLHLACVVLEARNAVHLNWNISGRYHKGQIISKEESDGTWTVMNFISLPKDTWSHGEKMTCEVWLQSSPISVHWEIPEQGEVDRYVASKCQNFLIPVVAMVTLLVLMLSVHLIWTLKLTAKKIPDLKGKTTEDEITYSKLHINHLARLKKSTCTVRTEDVIYVMAKRTNRDGNASYHFSQ